MKGKNKDTQMQHKGDFIMKKAILLVILLCLCVICASCGNKDNQDSSKVETATQQASNGTRKQTEYSECMGI